MTKSKNSHSKQGDHQERIQALESKIVQLEEKLKRLERTRPRGPVSELSSARSPQTARSPANTYVGSSASGSWSAADAYRSEPSSEAIATSTESILDEAGTLASVPTGSDQAASSSVARTSVRAPQISRAAADQALAAAVQQKLESIDVTQLAQKALQKKLDASELDDLILEKLETLFDSDQLIASMSEKLLSSTKLNGKKPEDLAREAMQKIFDGEGASNIVEKAMTKALKGKRPEDVVSEKVTELFQRFTNR